MKKILVTGGKGFIGSKIVEMLSKDYKVTVVDNHDTYGIMTKVELEKSKLDLVVAGTKDAVLMVESEAKGLTEEEMLNAVKFGHEGFVPVIEMIEELAKECKKPEWKVEKKDLSEVKKKLESTFTKDLKKLLLQEISKIDQIKFQKSQIRLKSFMKKMKIILILM